MLANLVGGYLIGIAVAFFSATIRQCRRNGACSSITGFLGGLTTFSTFSAESMMLLQRGQFTWAFAHIGLHLIGSIAFCIAGFATYRTIAG